MDMMGLVMLTAYVSASYRSLPRMAIQDTLKERNMIRPMHISQPTASPCDTDFKSSTASAGLCSSILLPQYDLCFEKQSRIIHRLSSICPQKSFLLLVRGNVFFYLSAEMFSSIFSQKRFLLFVRGNVFFYLSAETFSSTALSRIIRYENC